MREQTVSKKSACNVCHSVKSKTSLMQHNCWTYNCFAHMTLFISVQQKCSISQSVRSIWKLTVLLANCTDCLVYTQSHNQHHACFESTVLGLGFQIALADAACHKLKELHQCLQFRKKCARQRSHCPTTTLKNMKTSNLEDPHHNPLSEDETEL